MSESIEITVWCDQERMRSLRNRIIDGLAFKGYLDVLQIDVEGCIPDIPFGPDFDTEVALMARRYDREEASP